MKTYRIRALAKEKGLSLSFICSKLGVAHVYFIDIDKSNRDIPDDKLLMIADILNTTPCSYYTTSLAAYQPFFSEYNRKYLPIFMYEKCHILTA